MTQPAYKTAHGCIFSVFHFNCVRVGGLEMFVRQLSMRLAESGWRSVLCFPQPPSGAAAEFLAGPWATIESAPALFGSSLLKRVVTFWRLLRRYRPCIVHLHFLGYLSPYPWLAKLAGAKLVFFADHRSRPEGFRMMPLSPLRRLVSRAINYPLTAVISASDYGRRCHLAYRCLPPQRLFCIHNAVDLPRAESFLGSGTDFRKTLGVPDDHVLVTQISWMIPEKGIDDFIAAAQVIAAANHRVKFALVGAGSGLERFRREVAEAGLNRVIQFTGEVDDPFRRGIYEGSDIICQLSRWEEALGWVVLEAMAFGKPVLATRAGGISEAVQDGITGFLVEKRDFRAAAARVLELAADPALRARMGCLGKREAYARFALSRNITEHLRLYGIDQLAPAEVALASAQSGVNAPPWGGPSV